MKLLVFYQSKKAYFMTTLRHISHYDVGQCTMSTSTNESILPSQKTFLKITQICYKTFVECWISRWSAYNTMQIFSPLKFLSMLQKSKGI